MNSGHTGYPVLVVGRDGGTGEFRANDSTRRCEITFVGTATVLLRLGEFNVLTDPNFVRRGQWVYIGQGRFTRRRTDPAMTIAQLPELDCVILSQLRGDHFDRVARHGLYSDLPIFTTPHAAYRLDRMGFTEAVAMRTWQQHTLRGGRARLRITSLPARPATGPFAANLPPVMGTLVEYQPPEASSPLRVYLSGDTLPHPDLAEIAHRFPTIDVAVLHLGGARTFGALRSMDGRSGVDLLDMIHPRTAYPVHHEDYGIFRSPLSDFTRGVDQRKPTTVIRHPRPGQTHPLPDHRSTTAGALRTAAPERPDVPSAAPLQAS